MSPSPTVVKAAGAVIYREHNGEIEIVVVHRTKYDDWSLPKGKVDPGESLPQTAVRELHEETGYECALENWLCTTSYPLDDKEVKKVTYWSARAKSGDFSPNNEVDELLWLPVKKARNKVSYKLDRHVIDAFGKLPPTDRFVVLVRHAKAEDREKWGKADQDRPLTNKGNKQVKHLHHVLAAFDGDQVFTAPPQRCKDTVKPFARSLGRKVTVAEHLGDDFAPAHPDKAAQFVIGSVQARRVSVLCSQGTAIPAILRQLSKGSEVDIDDFSTKKAEAWVLGFSGSVLTTAQHLQNI